MKFITACQFLLATALSAAAQGELVFNYAGQDVRQWGTAKFENYDVAVRLADPSLAGRKITAVEIPGIPEAGVADCSVWLSSSLRLEGKVNAPDIVSIPASPEDSRIRVVLPEPYTIPTDGVYVGYSFKVTELTDQTKQPVSVGTSENPDAFMIHTSRSYLNWGNYALGLAADIAVTLEGQFFDNAVAVMQVPDCGALHGTAPSASAVIRNHGNAPVTSLAYTLTFADKEVKGSASFDPPLPAAYDSDVSLPLDVPAFAEAGQYPFTLKVTEVNGIANPDPDAEAYGCAYAYPYLPTHRPLVEDYTGTWCGWCTRGLLAMDMMTERHGDDFVAAAFHMEDDPMAIEFTMPTYYHGAPSVYLDRIVHGDPFFGTNPAGDRTGLLSDGFEADWFAESAKIATADISLTANWTDETCETIRADAAVTFVRPYSDADMRMLYILTADGLTGTRGWAQSNYYAGGEGLEGTDLEPLTLLSDHIPDQVFNEVAVAVSDIFGVEGSLPQEVPYLEECRHSFEFRIADAVNKKGTPIVQDKGRLNVIAAVVDATSGRIVNAVKCAVPAPTGIHGIADVTENAVTGYYDLTGNLVGASELNMPAGVYVRVTRSSSGVRSEKILVR